MSIFGGYLLVENAVKIGTHAGLDVWIIGITIVAATSSPELVTTLVSIVKKKYNMAIGNLIGSDLFNMLGVIGVAGIVGKGIQIPEVAHINSDSQSYGYSVFFEKFLETGAVGRSRINSD